MKTRSARLTVPSFGWLSRVSWRAGSRVERGCALLVIAAAATGCDSVEQVAGGPTDGPGSSAPAVCVVTDSDVPDFLTTVGCADDFALLASQPLDASIPGARSLKTVIDREDGNALYFQNSNKYQIHHEFVAEHLSVAAGLPLVPELRVFNQDQYTSPSRRFILGAITYYEGPQVWAYELAPYDTANTDLITTAFDGIVDQLFVGDELRFHPTSVAIEQTAAGLPPEIALVSTGELFEGIDYQPLNVAETYGRLVFVTAAELETTFVTFRDIVVLDRVPNDISVTQGIITAEFQTPLAHINVLAQNRGIPNMSLVNAYEDDELRALEDKWVRLEVGPFDYEIEEVSQAVADAWWDANKPSAVQVPGLDVSVTDLRDIADTVVVDFESGDMLAAIKTGTRAFGGKAANYGVLAHIEGLPVPKAFSVPIFYYRQFMEENGFFDQVEELLADESFQGDPAVRDLRLEELRAEMMVAPVNADFEQMLVAKLEAEYPDTRMRFRSSTNAEDLDGFTGAGLYTSKSGQIGDLEDPVLDAIREVWASIWFFRAFEERSYRSIDHLAVGMGLLVHHSFPDEEANGVALTNTPFDKSGLNPAFFVNVQAGEDSVVMPPPGVTTDSFLHFFDQQGQPVTYLSNSNRVPEGSTVLDSAQTHELGIALDKIRAFFSRAYAPPLGGWWAMDVEFKFDGDPGERPALSIKQARPFGNR